MDAPSYLLAAWKDTVWCVVKVDKSRLAVGRRTEAVDWAWDTLVSDSLPTIDQITAGSSGLLGFEMYPTALFKLTRGGVAPFVPESGTPQGQWVGFFEFPVDSGSHLDIDLMNNGITTVNWSQIRGGAKVAENTAAWGDVGYLGAFGEPAILFGFFRPGEERGPWSNVAIQTRSGEAWAVPGPTDTVTTGGAVAVFHDEIWTVIDGHLWKGALHLPPS